MEKNVKKILICFISFFYSILVVNANGIHEIDMDIYINSNGDAIVSEKWDASIYSGTELYKRFSDIGNSSISNFSVNDDSGRIYDNISHWNINASFDQKAYKSGINLVNGNIELCWGISKYGNRHYYLTYNINNLVTQYTDAQGIYFNLLSINQDVDIVNVNIHSDTSFSLDNTRIWSFGNYGNISFSNGNIIFKSNGIFKSKDYMVLLVRFQKKIFNTENKSNKSFDVIYESAFSTVKKSELLNITQRILLYVLLVIVIILISLIICNRKNKVFNKSVTIYKYEGNIKTPKKRDINYWREIPCNNDIFEAYWISTYCLKNPSSRALKTGIIGAVLLKWYKDGKINIIKDNNKHNVFDNNYVIDFSNFKIASNINEQSLLFIFLQAADKNKLLELTKFSKWCKNHYYQIDEWFTKTLYKTEECFSKNKLVVSHLLNKKMIFGGTKYITIKIMSLNLRDEANHLLGLKRFLLNFSKIPERQFIEVHTWENYLIFAQLLGIAKKVSKQFKKMYPNTNFKNKINFISDFSNDFVRILYKNMKIGEKNIKIKYGYHMSSYSSSKSVPHIDYSGISRYSGSGGSSFHSGGTSSGGSSGGGIR